MKSFDVYVEANSYLTVEAESEQEAKDLALEMFNRWTVDSLEATVMHESEID